MALPNVVNAAHNLSLVPTTYFGYKSMVAKSYSTWFETITESVTKIAPAIILTAGIAYFTPVAGLIGSALKLKAVAATAAKVTSGVAIWAVVNNILNLLCGACSAIRAYATKTPAASSKNKQSNDSNKATSEGGTPPANTSNVNAAPTPTNTSASAAATASSAVDSKDALKV